MLSGLLQRKDGSHHQLMTEPVFGLCKQQRLGVAHHGGDVIAIDRVTDAGLEQQVGILGIVFQGAQQQAEVAPLLSYQLVAPVAVVQDR